jgi:hypothetical protein
VSRGIRVGDSQLGIEANYFRASSQFKDDLLVVDKTIILVTFCQLEAKISGVPIFACEKISMTSSHCSR